MVASATAKNPETFIENGGFEVVASSPSTEQESQYETLFERGVVFPHDSEPMPKLVVLNSGEGWEDSQCIFEYVKGTPEAEVHSGSRAIRITSPRDVSSVMLGKLIPVGPEEPRDGKALQTRKTYKYSFFAKGEGTVHVRFYMYESVTVLENIYDYAENQTVKPEGHEINSDGKWHEYTGEIAINGDTVGAVRFVISAHGEVTIDDVQFAP